MFAEYTDSERGAKRWNLLAVYQVLSLEFTWERII